MEGETDIINRGVDGRRERQTELIEGWTDGGLDRLN